MTRFAAPILASILFTACQSVDRGPITAANLPEPRVASGQPRFPVRVDTDVAAQTPEVVIVDEEVVVPDELVVEDDCTPDATSPGAVGDPCATTRSFMESLGFGDKAIAAVIASGQNVAAMAH